MKEKMREEDEEEEKEEEEEEEEKEELEEVDARGSWVLKRGLFGATNVYQMWNALAPNTHISHSHTILYPTPFKRIFTVLCVIL